MEKIELARDNKILVYKKGYTPRFIQKIITKKKLDGLFIFDHAYPILERITDFDFLREFSFLEGLAIATMHDANYKFLKYLPLLKYLALNNQGGTESIDLSYQNNLEELAIDWRKNIIGIENCKKIKKLCLIQWKEKDLSFVGNLDNLIELKVKTASIKNLHGLENLKLLENLMFGNCRYLTEIKALNGNTSLKSLEFWSCSKIEDLGSLDNLPNLERLEFIDCKDIKSIKFIKSFPRLNKLCLNGNTSVLDGDLKPALGIKDVWYAPKKH
ncbi:MAG: leucine-rich repeat protein, partial [FCB group bacterium]